MGVSYLTSDTLIESVKRRGSIPESQETFTDSDFLDLANEEMMIGLVPAVQSFHEDYFLHDEDVALVASQSKYDIPYRALGNKLRDVAWLDSNGDLHEMTRISNDNRFDYQYNSGNNTDYEYFVVKGSQVELIPGVGTNPTGSLRFTYYLRPNQLVDSDRVGVITAIDTDTGEVTLSSVPSIFTTSLEYDFVKTKSPHKVMAIDLSISAINTTTNIVTFTAADLPTGLAVGDRVCVAEETDIPNIPTELHVVLAQRVNTRCLEALGDTQGLSNANTKLQEMEVKTGSLVDNRVEGSPQKVVNRFSPLRLSSKGRKGGL